MAIFIFQKIKNKLKFFSSPLFKKESSEKGAIPELLLLLLNPILGSIALLTGGTDWFGDFTTFSIKSLAGILLAISTFFLKMSATLFEAIGASTFLQQPLTRGTGIIATTVLHGWAITRDFTNMFIVLGFVAIGIATILRIREYEAQKKLIPLIIVALLINFSVLICGLVVDAANITMTYFTSVSGPAGITQPYYKILDTTAIQSRIRELAGEAEGSNSQEILIYFSSYLAVCVFTVVAAMIFFVYGILFLARYVALTLLIILSPLAFFCSVFPATRQVYEKWKSQFIQWAIIGIPAAFFIYLGGHLLSNIASTPIVVAGGGSDIIGASLMFWIPTAFLLFAYSLIFQTSAIGASAALGAATGIMGFAVGASKWTGKKLGGMGKELAGRTTLGKSLAGGYGDIKSRTLEKLGLAPTGSAAQQQTKRKKEATDMLESLQRSSAIGDRQKFENYVRSGRGLMGATAVSIANEKGVLGKIMGDNLSSINGRVALAQQFGHNRSDFEKKNYRLIGLNDQAINQTLTNRGIAPATATTAQRDTARENLVLRQLKANLPNMSGHELNNIEFDHLFHNYDIIKEHLTPHMISQFAGGTTGPTGTITALKTHLGAVGAAGTLIDDHNKAVTAGNTAEATRLQKQIDAINRL